MSNSQSDESESQRSQRMVNEQWDSQADFLVSGLGYCVGLANVWRFPYLAYRSGGGAFLIPYTIVLFLIGIPMFVLELTLGQFTSRGPTACWEFCCLFQGCGIAMLIVTGLTATYYNVIISYIIFYLFASFSETVPWKHCGDWSSQFCREKVHYVNLSECISRLAYIAENNGTCIMPAAPQEIWIYNNTLAKDAGIKITFAAKEYFKRRVTGSEFGHLSSIGPVNNGVAFCLFMAWTIVYVCVAKGIKTSGKVVYVTVTTPYIFLLVLLLRGMTLDGASDGIKLYLSPNLTVLKTAKVWKDATTQVFFSSACSYGGLITLSSYNRFYNDVIRDSFIITVGDSLTSVFAGFVIFSYLGFLAKYDHVTFDQVATEGPTLAFGLYPYSLTKLPGTSWWSVFFFIAMLFLGLDSQFVLIETLATCFTDCWPDLRHYKWQTITVICTVMFVAGLPLTTYGGLDIVELLDNYAGGWNVIIIALCECIAVGWIYGAKRFLQDINLMVGDSTCGCCHFYGLNSTWWTICWKLLTPGLSMFVIIFSWVDYQRIERFPLWADYIGWSITLSGISCIIGFGAYNVVAADGVGFEKIRIATRPTTHWGPIQLNHRELVAKYVNDFVIDPEGAKETDTGSDNESQTAVQTDETETADQNEEVETVSSQKSTV